VGIGRSTKSRKKPAAEVDEQLVRLRQNPSEPAFDIAADWSCGHSDDVEADAESDWRLTERAGVSSKFCFRFEVEAAAERGTNLVDDDEKDALPAAALNRIGVVVAAVQWPDDDESSSERWFRLAEPNAAATARTTTQGAINEPSRHCDVVVISACVVALYIIMRCLHSCAVTRV
jgi:hypothetical protein